MTKDDVALALEPLLGKPRPHTSAEEKRDPAFSYMVEELECDNGLFLGNFYLDLRESKDADGEVSLYIWRALVGGLVLSKLQFREMVGQVDLDKMEDDLSQRYYEGSITI